MSEANHTLAERGEREITQEDRELAALILLRGPQGDHVRMNQGGADHFWLVKAIARHRIAARNAALDEAARVAEGRAGYWRYVRTTDHFGGETDHGMVLSAGANDAANAICQLSTQSHTNGES
jgi:hypothetical protein